MALKKTCGGPAHPLEVPDIIRLVASFLNKNEAACTLLRVNKTTAKVLSGHGMVVLRQPVPRHAFVAAFGNRRALERLTTDQKYKLLAHTAQSRDLDNLQTAVQASACELTEAVFNGAALGGSLQVCQWLLARRCPFGPATIGFAACTGKLKVILLLLNACTRKDDCDSLIQAAWKSASRTGRWNVCEELQRLGFHCPYQAVLDAAHAGHGDRTERLLKFFLAGKITSEDAACVKDDVLIAVALKCGLRDLQRLCAQCHRYNFLGQSNLALPLLYAFLSSTPDWQLKVQWLRAKGADFGHYRASRGVWEQLLSLPDWVERLRQLVLDPYARDDFFANYVQHILQSANMPELQRFISAGFGPAIAPCLEKNDSAHAVLLGDISFLTQLLALGCPIGTFTMDCAVEGGHLDMLELMAGPNVPAEQAAEAEAVLRTRPSLLSRAISRGDLDMARWLRERGCPWPQGAVSATASSGKVDLLEWLLQSGCPMEDPDKAYLAAGKAGNASTLPVLQLLVGPLSRCAAERLRSICTSETIHRWLTTEWRPADEEMEETTADELPSSQQQPQQLQANSLWKWATNNLAVLFGKKRQREEEVDVVEEVDGGEGKGQRRVKRRVTRHGSRPQ
ncbi:hypothetical protein Vafri_21369 [Volvox africanus]|uniref:Uncharacterized protein n=1 Tax=Volvox africanus TaxID=51714 RepID=A0A8J4BVH3_9CHLO|nr:hypothetical protein Vafri_21369 [Volvox africanus]